jgi:hypothetical protein
MEPRILDNLLPETFVSEIEHTLTRPEFDWHYKASIAYEDNSGLLQEAMAADPNIRETRGFAHRFYYENTKFGPYCDFIRPILYFIEDKAGIPVNSIERIRAVLIPPEPLIKDCYNMPHVDLNYPHKTLIYYVNDCDSGTILFKEKYDFTKVWPDPSRKTIEHRIESKRGRCVVFDGATYHTGIFPEKNDKILININFT